MNITKSHKGEIMNKNKQITLKHWRAAFRRAGINPDGAQNTASIENLQWHEIEDFKKMTLGIRVTKAKPIELFNEILESLGFASAKEFIDSPIYSTTKKSYYIVVKTSHFKKENQREFVNRLAQQHELIEIKTRRFDILKKIEELEKLLNNPPRKWSGDSKKIRYNMKVKLVKI